MSKPSDEPCCGGAAGAILSFIVATVLIIAAGVATIAVLT